LHRGRRRPGGEAQRTPAERQLPFSREDAKPRRGVTAAIHGAGNHFAARSPEVSSSRCLLRGVASWREKVFQRMLRPRPRSLLGRRGCEGEAQRTPAGRQLPLSRAETRRRGERRGCEGRRCRGRVGFASRRRGLRPDLFSAPPRLRARKESFDVSSKPRRRLPTVADREAKRNGHEVGGNRLFSREAAKQRRGSVAATINGAGSRTLLFRLDEPPTLSSAGLIE